MPTFLCADRRTTRARAQPLPVSLHHVCSLLLVKSPCVCVRSSANRSVYVARTLQHIALPPPESCFPCVLPWYAGLNLTNIVMIKNTSVSFLLFSGSVTSCAICVWLQQRAALNFLTSFILTTYFCRLERKKEKRELIDCSPSSFYHCVVILFFIRTSAVFFGML